MAKTTTQKLFIRNVYTMFVRTICSVSKKERERKLGHCQPKDLSHMKNYSKYSNLLQLEMR